MARLERIWLKRARRGAMDAQDRATLVENAGLLGNTDQGGNRQVTILSSERWARAMASLGADLDPSSRRANLLVSGIDLVDSRDKILRVGDCRIRIRGETRPCERMDEALGGLQEELRSDWGGGAYGQVITGGEIRPGDPVDWETDQS
jgi:MOSC domain-containing protein YiiM